MGTERGVFSDFGRPSQTTIGNDTTRAMMEDMLREQDWTGFFLEEHRGKGWMNIRLQFQDGIMKGEGVDYVGTWHLQGVYSVEQETASWTKRYLGQHDVQYDGRFTDAGIIGQWNIKQWLTNQFHIWPVSMTHVQQEYLAAEEPVDSPGSLREPFGRVIE